MPRSGRFLLICLLLVLLPVRSLFAAGWMATAEPAHAVQAQAQAQASHCGEHDPAPEAVPAGACQHCAPCCLAAAPPPLLLPAPTDTAPADSPRPAATTRWDSVVPALPDPPPRG